MIGAVELDFPVTPVQVIYWLNDYELTWSFPLVAGQSMLGIYNLQTKEVTMTGIVNPIAVSGRWVLVQGIDKVYVYE